MQQRIDLTFNFNRVYGLDFLLFDYTVRCINSSPLVTTIEDNFEVGGSLCFTGATIYVTADHTHVDVDHALRMRTVVLGALNN